MTADSDHDAEYAPEIKVVTVSNWQAYCITCGWRGVQYGDPAGAQRSGDNHKREKHGA